MNFILIHHLDKEETVRKRNRETKPNKQSIEHTFKLFLLKCCSLVQSI